MRWTLSPQPDAVLVEQLSKELNVDPILASLLVGRGIDAFAKAKSFFRPSLEELHDPFLMKGMNEAAHRIQKAVGNNETIMVYGDYDVDGTTAVALMSSFLSSFYDKVTTYIPDRYKEGYGISYTGIDYAHDNDISLIIALDCGIKAIDKVKYAKEKGIDFIICDHHRPGKFVPDAVAVLDPKQHDCSYPYDELCGCGVGFKLCQALVQHNDWEFEILIPYLDLVATAIAADIVPITGENRILCYHGLNVINTSPRAGFKSIIEQVKKNILDITDVVFIIAPRINAAGRMKHGLYAVDLLVEQDLDQARLKAKEIDRYNQDRRELDQLITEEALQQIHDNKEEKLFTSVVFKEDWHKGVIGIVASRLTETHYRPTLVFTKNGDKLAASARSVSGYDVYNALEQCSEFIEQFGGHKYAAGLTMQPEQFLNFKKRFEEVVCATIDKKLLTKELKIDALLPLERITGKLYRILKQMAPFGPRNMRPVFLSRAVYDSGYAKRIGENGKHLKLAIKPHVNSSLQIPAIGFNLGDCISIIQNNKPFDVVYVLEENSWQGVTSLQLRIKDLKPH